MRAVIALLFVVSAISAETLENYKRMIRPDAEACQRQLNASDDEMYAMVNLQRDLFSHKAKCLAACVLERLGVMKNGRWTAVPAERRLEVYHKVFAGDTNRLEFADPIINICHVEADEKYKDKEDGCEAAYDAIACLWHLTY